jgi:hypothetical protein
MAVSAFWGRNLGRACNGRITNPSCRVIQPLSHRAKPAPGLYHGPSAVKNETATLRDQVVNDFAVDIRQPEIAARVAIGESLVVEAE